MKREKRKPYYCEQRQSWIVHTSSGHAVFIDEDDVGLVGDVFWQSLRTKRNPLIYARGWVGPDMMLMHRLILGAKEGQLTDHINGNSLDNRKANLRICTSRENGQNRKEHRNGKLVGATFDKRYNRWQSRIRNADGVLTHLGIFGTQEEAHERYMEECKKISGL